MHFRIILSTLLSFALIGCGSDSKNDYEIYGTWEKQSKYFDYQEGLLTVYSLNELHSCYLADYSIIEKISDSHYIELLSNGFSFTSQWDVVDNVLTVKGELGSEIKFSRSDYDSDLLDVCTSASHPGDINISVSFQNLPSVIQVNHEFTLDNHSEYGVDIQFDLNNNNQKDIGDLVFYLYNVKRDGHPESEVNLNYLEASVTRIKNVDENGHFHADVVGNVSYAINENSMDIAIYKFDHPYQPQLPTIARSVNIKAYSWYVDRNGIYQNDYFPDNGYTSGLDLSYMLDNSDDVNFFNKTPNRVIVDIEEISIISD